MAAAVLERTVQRVVVLPQAHVSVLQFNVLGRKLSPDPVNGSDEAKAAVDFALREPLNLRHISDISPDLVVLEEVDDPADFYGPQLKALGYDLYFSRKPSGTGDCTCVFYKTAALELAHRKTVFFGTPEKPASQFCLLCGFRDKRHSSRTSNNDLIPDEFVLIAQHAKAGRNEQSEAIRLEHARRIVTRELPEFQRELFEGIDGGKHAESRRFRYGQRIIWAGDFNAGPHSYGGKYPCEVLPWLTCSAARGADGGLVFQSAMAAALSMAKTGKPQADDHAVRGTCEEDLTFTTCKQRDGDVIAQTIDFVLYPRDAAITVGWLPEIAARPETELAPLFLPNTRWGSDHVSVYAELVWTTHAGATS